MLDILPRQDIINEDVQDIIITLDVARAVQEKAIISLSALAFQKTKLLMLMRRV